MLFKGVLKMLLEDVRKLYDKIQENERIAGKAKGTINECLKIARHMFTVKNSEYLLTPKIETSYQLYGAINSLNGKWPGYLIEYRVSKKYFPILNGWLFAPALTQKNTILTYNEHDRKVLQNMHKDTKIVINVNEYIK